MATTRLEYTYWQNDGWFLGYLNKYPGFPTQGKNLAELEDMLADILSDIEREPILAAPPDCKTGVMTIETVLA